MRAKEYHVLLEGIKNNIEAMFTGLEMSGQNKTFLDKEMKWAFDTFKRFNKPNIDRITWYMRFVRVLLTAGTPNVEDKSNNKMAQKLGVTIPDLLQMAEFVKNPRTKEKFKHYNDSGIPKLEQFVFKALSPENLFSAMDEIEEKHHENRSRMVVPADDVEMVVKVDKKHAWFDLNTSSCDAEAKAMGHCGTSSTNRASTILSYREVTVEDSVTYHTPYLTFTIDDRGFLSETKARFNQKPGKEFHHAIIKLMLDDRVKGITNTGYKPETNFQMKDLDSEKIEWLKEKKPELFESTVTYMNKDGTVDLDALQESLKEYELQCYDLNIFEGDRKAVPLSSDVIISDWGTFDNFVSDVDYDFGKLLEKLDEGLDEDNMEIAENDVRDILDRIDDRYTKRILDDLGERTTADAAFRIFKNEDKYYKLALSAYTYANNEDNDIDTTETVTKKEFIDILNEMVNDYWYYMWNFPADESELKYEGLEGSDRFDVSNEEHRGKSVYLMLSLSTIIEVLEHQANGEDEDDYEYEFENVDVYYIKSNGWAYNNTDRDYFEGFRENIPFFEKNKIDSLDDLVKYYDVIEDFDVDVNFNATLMYFENGIKRMLMGESKDPLRNALNILR